MQDQVQAVLIIDDEENVAKSLERSLHKKNSSIQYLLAHDAKTAYTLALKHQPSITILDLTVDMAEGPDSGMRLLDQLLEIDPLSRIIVLTGHSKHSLGIEALHRGAFTFLEKPADTEVIYSFIIDGIDVVTLKRNHKKNLGKNSIVSHELGVTTESEKMHVVLDQVQFAIQTNQPVLITGETGTGKGLLAKLIHNQSTRKKLPFVRYQPSFTNSDLVASELFGHKKGSFTGATEDKKGLIEEAHGGTLFIDEIDSLPKETQVALLETLQEKTFRKVGTSRELKSDFRLIAALNKDPLKTIKEGLLREDFYHRIAHCIIHLPSLRDRKEDIELLSQTCLDKICERERLQIAFIDATVIRKFKLHTWPGNIRELQAAIESAAYRATIHGRKYISLEDIHIRTHDKSSENSLHNLSFRDRIKSFEEQIVAQALNEAKGNQAQAAKNLQVDRTVFRRILERIGEEE